MGISSCHVPDSKQIYKKVLAFLASETMGGNTSSVVRPSGTFEVDLEDETEDAVTIKWKPCPQLYSSDVEARGQDPVAELEITETIKWRRTKCTILKLGGVTSYNHQGLNPKSTYSYRIRVSATETEWSEWSTPVKYSWETRVAIAIRNCLHENQIHALFEKLHLLEHMLDPLVSEKRDLYRQELLKREQICAKEGREGLNLEEIKDVIITVNTQIAINDINKWTEEEKPDELLKTLQRREAKLENVDDKSKTAYLRLLREKTENKRTSSNDSSREAVILTHSDIQEVINIHAALLGIDRAAKASRLPLIIEALKEKLVSNMLEITPPDDDSGTLTGYAVLLVEAKQEKLEQWTWTDIKQVIDYHQHLVNANRCESDVVDHLQKLNLQDLNEDMALEKYYVALIKRKQEEKKKEKEKGFSFLTSNSLNVGLYAENLTRSEVQVIVNQQNAVLEINKAIKEENGEKTMDVLVMNQERAQLGGIDRKCYQCYQDLLYEELKGFSENIDRSLLSRDDIQHIIDLHHALENVNKVLDHYNQRNSVCIVPSKVGLIDPDAIRRKEEDEAKALTSHATKIMPFLRKLDLSDLDDESSRGYLRLMSQIKLNKKLQMEQSNEEISDAEQSNEEILDAEQSNDAILDAKQSSEEILDAEQSSEEILDAEQSNEEILVAEQSSEDISGDRGQDSGIPVDTGVETSKGINSKTSQSGLNTRGNRKLGLYDILPCLKPTKPKESNVDEGYAIRLKPREIQHAVNDWKIFEDLAELLASKEIENDDKATQKFIENITKDEGITKRMLNYMYKLDRDAEGALVEDGEDEEELWGHNFLHLALCFNKRKSAQLICKMMPKLIIRDIGTWPDNEKKYLGLTPFHISVAYADSELVQQMLLDMKSEEVSKKDWASLLHGSKIVIHCSNNFSFETEGAIGRRMKGTVFMGQLPLHVAMLCHINSSEDISETNETNKYLQMIELLLKGDAKLDARNYKNDTVLHTIVEFVNYYPKFESRAVDAIRYIEKKADSYLPSQHFKREFFFARNENFKTALQLCTEYGQVKIFRCLLDLKDVYSVYLPHDDIYQMTRIDVTEIDKIALIDYVKKSNKAAMKSIYKEKSVTEVMSCLPLPAASQFAKHDVFKMLLERKWPKYRRLFYSLFVFHISFMVMLCSYAIEKSKRIDTTLWPYDSIVLTFQILSLLLSLVYIIQEFVLRFGLVLPKLTFSHLHQTLHSFMDQNGLYRLLSVFFALFLVIDFILMFVAPNNWCLVFALICGTWMLFFFLRAFKWFSLYIVLINEALFDAVIPFLALIILQLVIFSVAMYATFLRHEAQISEDFETFGKSVLTMGKLMIGLTEVSSLLETKNPGLTVVIFSIFLLITFLLMINALVAIMTQRFVSDQLDREIVWHIQKLSIIAFIEGWFTKWEKLNRFAVRTGRLIKRHESNVNSQSDLRYIMSYRKILTELGQSGVSQTSSFPITPQTVSDQVHHGERQHEQSFYELYPE